MIRWLGVVGLAVLATVGGAVGAYAATDAAERRAVRVERARVLRANVAALEYEQGLSDQTMRSGTGRDAHWFGGGR